MTKALTTAPVDSPVGQLTIVASNAGLRAVLWPEEHDGRVTFSEATEPGEHPVIDQTATQLSEYLHGDRREFDVPLDLVGTDFQQLVWAGLCRIPFGETQSYGELAIELSKPGAARAVGAATGRNPVSIIVPCHRVIGASGKLTGFAGGIEAKQWLLAHESASASLF